MNIIENAELAFLLPILFHSNIDKWVACTIQSFLILPHQDLSRSDSNSSFAPVTLLFPLVLLAIYLLPHEAGLTLPRRLPANIKGQIAHNI